MIDGQPEPAPAEACTEMGATPIPPKPPGVLTWCAMALGFIVFFAVGSILIWLPDRKDKPATRTFGDYRLLRRLQIGPLSSMKLARRMNKKQ